MLSDIKEWIKDAIFNRFTLLLIIYVVLIVILVQRLFVMQIINGQDYLNNFKLTIKKETTLKSTRGNIYDRNGNLLAYNKLAYAVTIEDNFESGKKKNALINDSIFRAIKIVESCGDTVSNDFNIILNDDGQYEFAVTGTKLTRFLADIYGHKSMDDLTTSERNSTPEDVVLFLADSKKYGIGHTVIDEKGDGRFVPLEGYTKEEVLKIMTVRYQLSTNSYQKYLSTVIADDVNENTVAAIKENSDILQGVGIEVNTLRKYNEAQYFAHIIGYTGNASPDDLAELAGSSHDYNGADMVGKSGIEKSMEEYLQGTKGKDVIYVDNMGKIIESISHVDPKAGNDVYLSIDTDLQKAVYNMLEQKLAGILVSKIVNMKTYNNDVVKSSLMMIPIDDVYYALINNNVIDTEHLAGDNASTYEKQVYDAFVDKQSRVMAQLREELLSTKTVYRELPDEFKVYESYIVTRLMSQSTGVLVSDLIDRDDSTYINWTTNETISLNEYLHYCLANNWIDVTKFHLDSQYSDSEEVYRQLVDYIIDDLSKNSGFGKKIYKYMIADNEISGKQLCMILYEQKIVYGNASDKAMLESGAKTPYDFMINKISNLEITPAMLALDPCSGSCVVANTKGELLALVTYPGYDNNRFANSIDSEYYAKLLSDLASPLYNNATQQMTAPGSTFKPCSAACALEEGVVNIGETIKCEGVFEYFDVEKQCWVYPGAHGALDVASAIGNSCNCFFYEVGMRLATNTHTSNYDEQLGLDRLQKYADLFGLTTKTGIEMEENNPKFSDELPVDSAIGQGSHNYTTVGLSRYVTTIATKGTCYKYTLLDKIVSQDGTVLFNGSPEIQNSVLFADSTWSQVYRGMREVVERAKPFKGFSIETAGKTGTAQTSKSRTNHALFIGFAPYDDPEITVATRIAYGYTSANAAQLSRDVLSYYFKVENAEDLVNGVADETTTDIIED
ncbi:MAG: penicillin-binding protein [Lachnospiraceae bacterium]|nr:penicillin-binding protein [Lachnospiraceae bacterium]